MRDLVRSLLNRGLASAELGKAFAPQNPFTTTLVSVINCGHGIPRIVIDPDSIRNYMYMNLKSITRVTLCS